jgi:hypothetical protein
MGSMQPAEEGREIDLPWTQDTLSKACMVPLVGSEFLSASSFLFLPRWISLFFFLSLSGLEIWESRSEFINYYVSWFINFLFLFLKFLCIYFYITGDLNSGPTPWATPPALFCDGFFFKIGSCKLLAQAGFIMWSYRSLPPE